MYWCGFGGERHAIGCGENEAILHVGLILAKGGRWRDAACVSCLSLVVHTSLADWVEGGLYTGLVAGVRDAVWDVNRKRRASMYVCCRQGEGVEGSKVSDVFYVARGMCIVGTWVPSGLLVNALAPKRGRT